MAEGFGLRYFGSVLLALAAGVCLTGSSMEEVPFEVLKERPRRQSAQPMYEVEKRGGAVIVTIHAGRKPTGGYAVRVHKVERDGSRCTVHYVVTEPPPDAMVTQVITYPAVMVRLPSECEDVAVQPPLRRGAAAGEER
jgi:hypothetical protein